eukprot:scaffold120125_cov22-Tisochrysis_lutea.AAC.1
MNCLLERLSEHGYVSSWESDEAGHTNLDRGRPALLSRCLILPGAYTSVLIVQSARVTAYSAAYHPFRHACQVVSQPATSTPMCAGCMIRLRLGWHCDQTLFGLLLYTSSVRDDTWASQLHAFSCPAFKNGEVTGPAFNQGSAVLFLPVFAPSCNPVCCRHKFPR